jgi:hypothetical protein
METRRIVVCFAIALLPALKLGEQRLKSVELDGRDVRMIDQFWAAGRLRLINYYRFQVAIGECLIQKCRAQGDCCRRPARGLQLFAIDSGGEKPQSQLAGTVPSVWALTSVPAFDRSRVDCEARSKAMHFKLLMSQAAEPPYRRQHVCHAGSSA